MDSPNSYYLLDVTTNTVTSGYDIVDAPLVGSQDSVEWISECAPSLVATYQFNQATWTNFNVFGWDASNTFLFSASPGSWGRTVPAQEDCPNNDYFGHGIIATPNDGTVAHDSSGVPVGYTQRR